MSRRALERKVRVAPLKTFAALAEARNRRKSALLELSGADDREDLLGCGGLKELEEWWEEDCDPQNDKCDTVGRSGQSEQRKTKDAAVAGIRWLENGPQYPYFSRTLARIAADSFHTHTYTHTHIISAINQLFIKSVYCSPTDTCHGPFDQSGLRFVFCTLRTLFQ